MKTYLNKKSLSSLFEVVDVSITKLVVKILLFFKSPQISALIFAIAIIYFRNVFSDYPYFHIVVSLSSILLYFVFIVISFEWDKNEIDLKLKKTIIKLYLRFMTISMMILLFVLFVSFEFAELKNFDLTNKILFVATMNFVCMFYAFIGLLYRYLIKLKR